MSRQYLRQLQERAQKLLEVSSDEEEINAYTATARPHSPKIQLEDLLDDQSSFGEQNNTDLELLKKCISLTNQNNSLRSLVERQKSDIQSLEKQILSLESQLQNSRETDLGEREKDIREGLRENVSNGHMQVLQKLTTQMDFLHKEIKFLRSENQILNDKQSQLQKQKNAFLEKKEKDSFGSGLTRAKEDRAEYTNKTVKITQQDERFRVESQLLSRVRRAQGLLQAQKDKNRHLCQFINKQLPALRDQLVSSTAKLEHQVSHYLLRDIRI